MSKKVLFKRCDRPPAVVKVIPIMKVKADSKFSCVVCSHDIFGMYTHWNGRHTEPCMGDKKTCGLCKKGLPRRWVGYLHITQPTGVGSAFLELTATAANMLLNSLGEIKSLRATRIFVYRLGGKLRSPIQIDVLGIAEPAMQLPAPKDPTPTLSVVWKVAI